MSEKLAILKNAVTALREYTITAKGGVEAARLYGEAMAILEGFDPEDCYWKAEDGEPKFTALRSIAA